MRIVNANGMREIFVLIKKKRETARVKTREHLKKQPRWGP